MASDQAEPVVPCPKPRGRPRSVECHKAILCATNDLLEELGYGDVTMEAIAARAGVAKQTLYNWWSSKAKLTMEAYVARIDRRIPVPDTGAFATDLAGFLGTVCEVFSQGSTGRTFGGIIADAQRDAELGREFRDNFISRRRRALAAMIARGQERGEVPGELDVEVLLDMIYGPIWYRLLLRNAPLDERFARALTAHTLASVSRAGAADAKPGRRPPATKKGKKAGRPSIAPKRPRAHPAPR
jgi:AcrR family transcriptional regulator